MSLNHLHLHVRDLPSSRRFYEEYFGFGHERLNEGEFVILQNATGFDLALALDPVTLPMPTWFHFGFRLPNADDVLEQHERMISRGVKISKGLEAYENYVSFRCQDPDEYVIEVYWEPTGNGG